MPTPQHHDEDEESDLLDDLGALTSQGTAPSIAPLRSIRTPRFTYDANLAAQSLTTGRVFMDSASSFYGSNPPTHCINCNTEVTDANAHDFEYRENNLWCGPCFHGSFVPCTSCTEVTYSRNMRDVRRRGEDRNHFDPYCISCFSNLEIRLCGNCGNCFHPDDPNFASNRNDRCRRCARRYEETGTIELRNFQRPSELIEGADHGKIIKSTRPVGVELEAQFTNSKKAFKASLELDGSVGIGTDSSIGGGNGLEFRLPPASGNKAETIIGNTCETLLKNGFKVNPTCGMHIHFDVSDMEHLAPNAQLKMMKDLWSFYLMFEDVIVSFLPPSRRSRNRYCQPIRSDYSVKEVTACRTMDQIERLWYRAANMQMVSAAKAEHHHISRYRGINLHPLFSARHMEVRYHTGTLNTRKILEWANLHARIIDCAVNNSWSITEDSVQTAINEVSLAKKTDLMFRYLRMSEESQGYFIARQASFADSFKLDTTKSSFKLGMAELEAEKEQ